MTDSTRIPTAWQRHRAARLVAHHARDAQDLVELLDMLGLSAEEGRVPPVERLEPEPTPRPLKLSEDCAGRLASLLVPLHHAAGADRPAARAAGVPAHPGTAAIAQSVIPQ